MSACPFPTNITISSQILPSLTLCNIDSLKGPIKVPSSTPNKFATKLSVGFRTRRNPIIMIFASIFIIIIIIMSSHQRRYPWPSLATPPYRPLLPAGLQGYIRIDTELLYVGSSWSSCLCRSTSHMSSSLLLQLCSVCLVCLIWTIIVMGGRWRYSSYFVGWCLQDLFNIARSILV